MNEVDMLDTTREALELSLDSRFFRPRALLLRDA